MTILMSDPKEWVGKHFKDPSGDCVRVESINVTWVRCKYVDRGFSLNWQTNEFRNYFVAIPTPGEAPSIPKEE
ncbi:MAG TPA: hypothetical protein VGK74_02920 [Symbiobacteriaceae bacterium]|jgi:hypothetical protein